MTSTLISADSVDATPVSMMKHRCILVWAQAINTVAADSYLQLFDAAAVTDVTVGTTVPTLVVTTDPSDSTRENPLPTHGLVFVNGIVAASTTTPTGLTGAVQHVRLGIV